MGLSGNELFDEAMQDRMAMHLLNRRGYDDYLAGDLDEATFMRKVSQEWGVLCQKMKAALAITRGTALTKPTLRRPHF